MQKLSENPMYRFIDNFLNSDKKKGGLCLLATPPGSYKSTVCRQYLYNYIVSSENDGRKIFFLTPLKKNLLYRDLQGDFELDTNMLKIFEDNALLVESLPDMVYKCLVSGAKIGTDNHDSLEDWSQKTNWEAVHLFRVPRSLRDDICRMPAYTALWKKARRFFDSLHNHNSGSDEYYDDFREAERDFRNSLYDWVEKNFFRGKYGKQNTPGKKRAEIILHNERLKWIADLYPVLRIYEKKVVFMSLDKFIHPFSTFVEFCDELKQNPLVKNSIVFMDEFDACKSVMLGFFIKQVTQSEMADVIQFARSFANAQKSNEFPALLTEPPSDDTDMEHASKTRRELENCVSRLKELSEDVFDGFNLACVFKFVDDMSSSVFSAHRTPFLFEDQSSSLSVLDGDRKTLAVNYSDRRLNNPLDHVNRVVIEQKKREEERENLSYVLQELSGRFMSDIFGCVKKLARNYQNRENSNRKKESEKSKTVYVEFSFADAVKTVLDSCGIQQPLMSYWSKKVLNYHPVRKTSSQPGFPDFSFCSNGFRYYSIQDATDHDLTTVFGCKDFDVTPEKYLFELCKISKVKVVAVSATACVDTVLHNFDLGYLKSQLLNYGCSFISFSDSGEDYEEWKEMYSESLRLYDKVNIHAEPVSGCCSPSSADYSEDPWKEIFGSSHAGNSAYNEIIASINKDYDEGLNRKRVDKDESLAFLLNRYYRIFCAYKFFVTHSDIHSFLCILNKQPKPGDNLLDVNLITALCSQLREMCEVSTEDGDVFFLGGDDFDRKKDEMCRKLSSGKKLFVISNYSTIGTGQNLQYEIPPSLRSGLVYSPDVNYGDIHEKDFDGVYLDEPTNNFMSTFFDPDSDDDQEFRMVKAIFETEYMRSKSQIGLFDANDRIYNIFNSGMGKFDKKPLSVESWKDLPAVKNEKGVRIYQALGRIMRTKAKTPNVYILFSDSIDIDPFQLGVDPVPPEFKALLDKVNESAGDVDPETIKENEGYFFANVVENNNAYTSKYWDYHLRHITEPGQDKMDREYRFDFLLKFPNPNKCDLASASKDANIQSLLDVSYVPSPYGKPFTKYYYVADREHRLATGALDKNDSRFRDEKALNRHFPNGYRDYEVSEDSCYLSTFMRNSVVKDSFVRAGYATSFNGGTYLLCPRGFQIYKGSLGEGVGKIVFEDIFNIPLESLDPSLYEKFDYKVVDRPIGIDFKNWHDGFFKDRNRELLHIGKKAAQCGFRYILAVNMVSEKNITVAKKTFYSPSCEEVFECYPSVCSDVIEILEVPSLFNYDDSSINDDAREEIMRLVNNCSPADFNCSD